MPLAKSKKSHDPGSYHWLEKHKKSIEKQKGDVVSPISLLPLSMIRITKRFYNSAILKTLLRPTVTVDFDTGAEADLVDLAFTEQHALKIAPFSALALVVVEGGQISTNRVVHVPLTITDSWGTKRMFSRPCTVVDRKKRSSILLSMTALSKEFIYIEPFLKK